MNRFRKVENKLDRFAIRNLTWYLIGGQGVALILSLGLPGFLGAIELVPAQVLAGQWWRLLSFLFTPPFGNPIFALFTLYFLYFMGGSLEGHWGTFRYNVYVLIGYLMTIAAAFVFPYQPATNTYITTSIFLAFAFLYPDYQIFLFFVLPIRVKWLALVTWLFYGYRIALGSWPDRLMVLAAVANFLLFFGRDVFYLARFGHRKMRRQARSIADRDKPLHACSACGTTDRQDRTMEFRYCTKCDPPIEYCDTHLRSHEHVRAPAA